MTLLQAAQDVVADLEHYVRTHRPGPDKRLDALKQAIKEAEAQTKTTAEQIADRLGNDGMTWETEDGITLAGLARSQGSRIEAEANGARVRYAFADGSAIVVAGGAWDVEGPTPFSWAGGMQ